MFETQVGCGIDRAAGRLRSLVALTHEDRSLERLRVQAVLEWILQQERGHLHQLRIVLQPDAESLQRREVVGVSEIVPQLGVDLPVAIALGRTEGPLQMRTEIGRESVVVKQGVVDIEQERHVVCDYQGSVSSDDFRGCPPSSPAMTAQALGSQGWRGMAGAWVTWWRAWPRA